MHKIKPFLRVLLVLFVFIMLHNAFLTGVANIFSLLRQNNFDELTKKSYETKIESLEKTLLEYEKSQENLNIFDSTSHILSKIALRNIYDFYDYLTISTSSKVNDGAAVINENGLVGLVESANKTTAKVSLLTGKVNLSIKVGDAFGLLSGYDDKDNLLIVRNINNYKNVEQGNVVTTSGLQEVEGDIKIGTVEKIVKEGVEQIIYVKPYVDFNNLNYLMVINK